MAQGIPRARERGANRFMKADSLKGHARLFCDSAGGLEKQNRGKRMLVQEPTPRVGRTGGGEKAGLPQMKYFPNGKIMQPEIALSTNFGACTKEMEGRADEGIS
jgi:hypothetical protein